MIIKGIVLFDKPIGMATQLQKQLPVAALTEFDALKSYYIDLVKLGSLPHPKDAFKSTFEPGKAKQINYPKLTLLQFMNQTDKCSILTYVIYPLRKPLRVKHSKK